MNILGAVEAYNPGNYYAATENSKDDILNDPLNSKSIKKKIRIVDDKQ